MIPLSAQPISLDSPFNYCTSTNTYLITPMMKLKIVAFFRMVQNVFLFWWGEGKIFPRRANPKRFTTWGYLKPRSYLEVKRTAYWSYPRSYRFDICSYSKAKPEPSLYLTRANKTSSYLGAVQNRFTLNVETSFPDTELQLSRLCLCNKLRNVHNAK